MRIRSKIILITFPLIITPLILTMIISSLSARNSITMIANEFLKFKSRIYTEYMDSQWDILVSNSLDKNSKYVELSKKASMEYAFTLLKKESESIYIFDKTGHTVFSTKAGDLSGNEKGSIISLIDSRKPGWKEITLAGINNVSETFFFEPFEWFVIVAAEKKVLYSILSVIFIRTAAVLIVSLVLSFFFLIYFSGYLTRPLEHMVSVIQSIISTNDLTEKVPLLYQDETGKLSH